MPIYLLPDEPVFPNPETAREDGLLAIGGDLNPERLLSAYSSGIFPWYDDSTPILWWSPDPRLLLFPKDFKRHKNLRRTVNKSIFDVSIDKAFDKVIKLCAKTRESSFEGTWITKEMIDAYKSLHNLGYAHSVETWKNGELVGGLYGISIGAAFFGESMFHLITDASKVALWHLVDLTLEWNFDFIDAQQETSHLISLGAKPVKRNFFLNLLRQSLSKPTKRGKWTRKKEDYEKK
jgi:leucyl/phenylalanyl-tRNA--protein transferase